MLSSNRLDEIALGIHQVEINTVVHQIILSLLHPLRRAEVYPIRLAHTLDLLPTPRQANQVGMELLQVFLEHGRGVARRVAGDEHGHHLRHVLGRRLHQINHPRHLIQLLRADVRTVAEPKIHQRVLSLEILF